MRTALIALLISVLASCGAPPAEAPPKDATLAQLAKLMSGHFSSAAQAKEDESYFDIRLAMVPMWQDRKDGPWLYVEQAVARALERPYRQRVYRLRRIADGLYESRVYAFPDAKSRAGAWKEAAPLADLSPDDLEEKDGCGVVLRRRDDGTFEGGTLGMACRNTFGGAAYATSFVTVFDDRLEAWDRGYDAENKPVWGPDAGPYVFRRVAAP
jgi:hypothetical protein